MWIYFCPNTHSVCQDGHPGTEEHPCCFWDSIDETCLFVEGMRKSYDNFKQAQRIIDEIRTEEDKHIGKGEVRLGKKYNIKDILEGIERRKLRED